MNNGLNPTTDNEQVSFFDKNKKILFGLESMHKPHNGKLAYGRGRIALIFAHYNHFGMKDGKRDDHTGDSFYTFDMDGKNEDYAWSWATSHSLVQSILYDGRYFITASLGDAYPENIKLCYIKPNQYNSNVDGVRNKNVNLISKCKDVIPGKIPGNGSGGTCGTLGGIHKFGENISLVYSRKSCNITGPDGKASSDTTGNLGIVNLNYDDKDTIKEVNNKNIGNGNNIINIRSGKFGENILILFSTTPTPAENTKLNNHFYSNSDIFEYMIVNNDGVIQSERKKFENFNEFLIPNSSDLRELKNGGIIWGIPDKTTKKLVIMRSSIPNFSDPYSHTYSGLIVSDDSSSSNTSINNNTSSNTNTNNNTNNNSNTNTNSNNTNTNSTDIIGSNNTIINNGTLIDGIKNTSVEVEISEDDSKTETFVKYLDGKFIVILSIIAIFMNQ